MLQLLDVFTHVIVIDFHKMQNMASRLLTKYLSYIKKKRLITKIKKKKKLRENEIKGNLMEYLKDLVVNIYYNDVIYC